MLDAHILPTIVAHACARMFAETHWGLAMSIYLRLLGIAAVVFGFGPSEALLGDVWKGSWKFEMDRWDRPWVVYYNARGKTVFRFGCGTHFEMDAVYPGGAPEQDHTKAYALPWRRNQQPET